MLNNKLKEENTIISEELSEEDLKEYFLQTCFYEILKEENLIDENGNYVF